MIRHLTAVALLDPALLFVLVKGLQVQFIERLAREHAPITIGYSTSRQPCRNFAVRARGGRTGWPCCGALPLWCRSGADYYPGFGKLGNRCLIATNIAAGPINKPMTSSAYVFLSWT